MHRERIGFDLDRIQRIGDKIWKLLRKKTKNLPEAYLVLKMEVIFLESLYGFSMEPQEEEELRKNLKEAIELGTVDRSS